jgi:hypothetical protein
MAFFLTIRECTAPEDSYPILGPADPEIIQLVVRGLTRKLGGGELRKVSPLKINSQRPQQNRRVNGRIRSKNANKGSARVK